MISNLFWKQRKIFIRITKTDKIFLNELSTCLEFMRRVFPWKVWKISFKRNSIFSVRSIIFEVEW